MMRKMIPIVLIALLNAPIVHGQAMSDESGSLTDPRDSSQYRWVRIGGQKWLAENLRFKTDDGSWCWENIESNCDTLGRLYNWQTAMTACPPGWHLPSDDEWKTLEIALGLSKQQADQEGFRIDNDSLLAGKIKKEDAWPDMYEKHEIKITNERGFSAVATGIFSNGTFDHSGYTGWWSSSESDSSAWIRHIGFFDNSIGRVLNRKEFAFPVRCVCDKDNDIEY